MSDEARISEPAAQQRGVVTNESADHGVRTDVAPGEVRSRSADPGQSSYGGFRNEDPAMQHQADASKQDAAGKGGSVSRADADIQDRVCERLWRSGLDVSEVSVHVNEGLVTLEGAIGSRDARRALEDCVDSVRGVRDIANRVKVMADRSGATGR